MACAGGSTYSPTTSRNLSTKRGSFESLNWRTRCGWRPCARQIRWTELTLRPEAFAIKAPVQWIVSPGGSPYSPDSANNPYATNPPRLYDNGGAVEIYGGE